MTKIIEGYSCIAELREIRESLGDLYLKDPMEFISQVENAPMEFLISLEPSDIE